MIDVNEIFILISTIIMYSCYYNSYYIIIIIRYLHEKISNGKVGEITCPEYACYKLVPIVGYTLLVLQ